MLYTLTPQYAGGSATLVSLNVAGGPIAPGKYHLTVYSSQNAGLHDLSGNPLAGDGAAAGTSYVTTFNVTAPAPNLLSTSFGDGTTPAQTQRSEVRDIQLKFDHAVMLNSGAVTLALLNTGGSGSNNGGAPTDASAALGVPVTSDGGITWTVPILTNTSFSDKAGSLSDGIYTVTIHAAKVTDSSNNTLNGGDQSTTFHRLFGDIDGNKAVNNADFFQFKKAFGAKVGQPAFNVDFDVDANGSISNSDFFAFKKNFGKKFSY